MKKRLGIDITLQAKGGDPSSFESSLKTHPRAISTGHGMRSYKNRVSGIATD